MSETEQNAATPFSDQELLAFQALRARYEEDHDRFSQGERARLQFLRWLHQEGQLDSQSGNVGMCSGDWAHWVENPPDADRDVA
jgi:hypothetical protein